MKTLIIATSIVTLVSTPILADEAVSIDSATTNN